MSQAYKAGDILQAVFSGRVDGQIKPRPVLFWQSDSNSCRILVSAIYGTETQGKWECRLSPNNFNGLTKECFVRIDNTHYILSSNVLEIRGSLSQIEFNIIKKLLLEYSEEVKNNSPQNFSSDPFDILIMIDKKWRIKQ
jgi:hypothetical protein